MTDDLNVKSKFRKPKKSGEERLREKILDGLREKTSQFKLTNEMYLRVAQVLWADLDTPRSLTCWLLLKHKEYAQLVNLVTDPRGYVDRPDVSSFLGCPGGSKFRDDYQATYLLSKWEMFEHPDLDPVAQCIRSDNLAETNCQATNRRLRHARRFPEGNHRFLHLLSMMQTDIAATLGTFDPTEWEDSCRFGPGKASDQVGTIDYEKLVNAPSATPAFLLPGLTLLAGSLAWLEALDPSGAMDPFKPLGADREPEQRFVFDVTVSPGDKNSMVTKNAKTRRGIRAQPGLNVFAQLGLGEMKRKRLRLAGLDLNDQRPNQNLARRGSCHGSRLVTLDLASASGHICTELINWLYEGADLHRWKFAMDMCRTHLQLPHGAPEKSEYWMPLASYSAMGNGYTFELETLVFWSAVRACRRTVGDSGPYRVYGDDIICERNTAELLIPFLEFIGFPLNTRKSFIEGPFRESCGADFWNGVNVRPIHFSVTADDLEDENRNGTSILRWLQVCNSIRRQAFSRNHGLGCDRRLLASWRTAILHIPRDLRNSLKSCWVEDHDTTLITHLEDALTNPALRYCGSLQSLIGPRLYGRRGGITPGNFMGVRAALLYRRRGDRVVCRFDRNWSRLQRVLQLNAAPSSLLQRAVGVLSGINPGVELHGEILPSKYKLKVGGGWEVFQPLADVTSWSDCPEGSQI